MVSSRAAVFFFWIFIHFCAPRGAEPHVAGKFTSSWYYDMCMCPNNSAFYPHSSKVIIANVNCNEIVMTWWERLPVLWWKRMRRSEIARVSPIRLLCTSGAAVQQRCRFSVAAVRSKDRGPPDRTNFGPDQTAQTVCGPKTENYGLDCGWTGDPPKCHTLSRQLSGAYYPIVPVSCQAFWQFPYPAISCISQHFGYLAPVTA